MPHLEPFAIRVRSAKILAFMPVKLGKYELGCAAPLHATFGMRAIRREAHAYKNGSREPYQECSSQQHAIDAEGNKGEAREKSDEPPHGEASDNKGGNEEIGRAHV